MYYITVLVSRGDILLWSNSDELKKLLVDLESLKAGIMREINRQNANEQARFPTTVYPLAKIEPLKINGYSVIQFNYEGALPLYNNQNKKYLSMIRHYYFRSTLDCYDYDDLDIKFDRAVIVFVQYFKDLIVSDLDNRNTKYIQDAIRATNIINDDNWRNVWNMNMAFHDKTNHIQVYVLSQENFGNFYTYLLNNHNELKKNNDYIVKKEEVFNEYKYLESRNKGKNFYDSLDKKLFL